MGFSLKGNRLGGGYKRARVGRKRMRQADAAREPSEESEGKSSAKFKTVSLPTGLVERAEHLADNYPVLGYTSKTRLLEDGVRRYLESLEERVAGTRPGHGKD